MIGSSILLAIVIGILQGIFEWLPISSEGNITIILTALGSSPELAVKYALFLHLGTAVAATGYFRETLIDLLREVPHLHEGVTEHKEIWFLALATGVSGATGIAAYIFLIEAVTVLEGGLLVILIGGLLVVTGVFQRVSSQSPIDEPADLSFVDAILVGIGQGIAVLPGISRSGTTIGVLLLRGYEGQSAFRLSFILSIPAAIGAGVLVLLDSGGPIGMASTAGVVAVFVSALVGYATIDLLMRVVERVAFWLICILLGGLAIFGGILILL